MEFRPIIEDTIENELRHKHYAKVIALAETYEAFIMNDKDAEGNYPLDKYLRQFVRREDSDLFEQRKNLTKQYVPSICSQIMRPFTKVVRSNRIIKLIDHTDKKKVDDIEETITKFYGEGENSGVDQFLSERFLPLTFTDPNAWIWITFNKFDGDQEKPQTFPVEYSSKAVINYRIKNDQTQWVIVKLAFTYINKDDAEKTGFRYIIFGPNISVEYKENPEDIKEPLYPGVDTWENKQKKKFVIYEYKHNSDRVPLMRVGYRRDLATKSETFVNPFHYEALPLLMQFVKISSELQLSITLHAFPKQVTYKEECDNKGCTNGLMVDGTTTCKICNGTGKKVHTTAADIIEIPMPRSKDMGNVIDASKLAAYIDFPNGVLEFLDKYADKLEKKIIRMVYNSESLVQTQFNTATEAEIDVESIYDTLHPFADKYSELWMFFVKLTALYRNYDGVDVFHKFNSDYKFKPLNQLLLDLKTANESHAPSYIRESINNDIADIIYADDQTELAQIRIKNKHFPFPGKTDFEIQNIILNNLATKPNQILYANFDNIFDVIEIENRNFYQMTYVKQREILKEKIDLIIEELAPSVPTNNLNLN